MTGETKKGRYVYYSHRCNGSSTRTYLREKAALTTMDRAARQLRPQHNMPGVIRACLNDEAEHSTMVNRGSNQRARHNNGPGKARSLESDSLQTLSRRSEREISETDAGLSSLQQIENLYRRLPSLYMRAGETIRLRIWEQIATGVNFSRDRHEIHAIEWCAPFDRIFRYERIKPQGSQEKPS